MIRQTLLYLKTTVLQEKITKVPGQPEAARVWGPNRNFDSNKVQTGPLFSRRYRNRRLGDFLKELDLTEGKATGIPIIKRSLQNNGSPEAEFETDNDRSYFQVILRIHPEFITQELEGVNGGVNGGVNELLHLISKHPGSRVPFFAETMGGSVRSIERLLKSLRDEGKIEFKGAPKTGGYYAIE
ncbi:ATP-binding protein [Parapedobacter tibetensis]|uniref:ATP-binding protein n=1 Tax=Parapedobacter tibetensis TaxID=2972951 RepID=UPI00214DB6D8|nr:ATP-binding protein [Parapedobacter tibetensis]